MDVRNTFFDVKTTVNLKKIVLADGIRQNVKLIDILLIGLLTSFGFFWQVLDHSWIIVVGFIFSVRLNHLLVMQKLSNFCFQS